MIRKGQIVEIPASAPVYSRELPVFHSKRDELLWRSAEKSYSLFDGFLVGEHQGVEHFRIGQRKGINVGGKKEPLYVIGIDEEENRLFVGAGESHPGLWTEVIRLGANSELNNSVFSDEELEKGIEIKVSDAGGENISGKLYGWNGSFFLEFQKAVPAAAVNINPFDILYQDRLIKNITKN